MAGEPPSISRSTWTSHDCKREGEDIEEPGGIVPDGWYWSLRAVEHNRGNNWLCFWQLVPTHDTRDK